MDIRVKMRDFPVSPDGLMERLIEIVSERASGLIDEGAEAPKIFHPDQGGTWLDINPEWEIANPITIPTDKLEIAVEDLKESFRIVLQPGYIDRDGVLSFVSEIREFLDTKVEAVVEEEK